MATLIPMDETVSAVIDSSKGVIRQKEVLSETAHSPDRAREIIDELVIDGEIERNPVGEHIILKVIDEDLQS